MQKKARHILFIAVFCFPNISIGQNVELYWIPGLTLGYPSTTVTGEDLSIKNLWGVWFQYGHWGGRFYPTSKENHSIELDAIWFHTNPYGVKVTFNPHTDDFLGKSATTFKYPNFSGFGLGYNYNIYLPKRIQFSPGIKFNFLFHGVTEPSGIGGQYDYYDKENGTYEPRSFTMLASIPIPWSASVSFPIRFTWYTKKNFFLRWGFQYYLGFKKASYIEFINYDSSGNAIGSVTSVNRNRSLSIELGIGYKIDWKRLRKLKQNP